MVPVIEDTAVAITNTPNETWTQGLISSRLELLDRYWHDFVENHVALMQAEISPDLQYVVNKTYAKVEATYVEAKGRLLDAGARLRLGTSVNISSLNP